MQSSEDDDSLGVCSPTFRTFSLDEMELQGAMRPLNLAHSDAGSSRSGSYDEAFEFPRIDFGAQLDGSDSPPRVTSAFAQFSLDLQMLGVKNAVEYELVSEGCEEESPCCCLEVTV